jgi:hypothetical protein
MFTERQAEAIIYKMLVSEPSTTILVSLDIREAENSPANQTCTSERCNLIQKRINQIAVQHNYLLNKFTTAVEATYFGSYQRAIIRPYTIF